MTENACESLDVIIKNNSQETYYFNDNDIKHPSCGTICKDDVRMIKEFYFSLDADYGDIKSDMTMQPSSFSYELKPFDKIQLTVRLKEKTNDFYKIEFDETNQKISKTFVGISREKHFYIICSKEPFSYNGHYSDYCKKIKNYGIKLEGKQTLDKTIEFVIE